MFVHKAKTTAEALEKLNEIVRPCSAHDDDAGINRRRRHPGARLTPLECMYLYLYCSAMPLAGEVGSQMVRVCCQWCPGRTAVAYIVLKHDLKGYASGADTAIPCRSL
jgi:hypothetical protein